MTQATAPTTAHHVATIDLGARGTADVWIREAGIIDIDMPTRNGGTYTLGSDPISADNTADRLEAGDYRGFGDLTPEQATALATALRAGITAEGEHGTDPLAHSERLAFDNGDHVTLAVEQPNYVEARGHIAGDTFHVSLRSDVAHTEADLLLNGNSPDALWNLPQDQARRLGHAMLGAAVAARHTPQRRSACPSWCEDRDQADHWTHPGTTWQAIHARRFGTVGVYLPHEIHDDGERWMGRCEVTLTHPDNSQQMDGETVMSTGQAGTVAADLTRAAAFATRLDLHIAAQAAQGIVTTDEVTR